MARIQVQPDIKSYESYYFSATDQHHPRSNSCSNKTRTITSHQTIYTTIITTMQFTKTIVAALSLTPAVAGNPVSYATCQAGCNQMVRVCYTVAGFTFGTVPRAAAPASIAGCNLSFGRCQATCAHLARYYLH